MVGLSVHSSMSSRRSITGQEIFAQEPKLRQDLDLTRLSLRTRGSRSAAFRLQKRATGRTWCYRILNRDDVDRVDRVGDLLFINHHDDLVASAMKSRCGTMWHGEGRPSERHKVNGLTIG
jgi:hypothetical protein